MGPNTAFTSALSRRELICALLWLPIHIFVLPRMLLMLMENGTLSEAQANLLVYVLGAVYVVLTCFSFLRRDFDPLCDHPFACLAQIALCYCMMMAFNLFVSGILSLVSSRFGDTVISNQNNDAIVSLALEETGPMTAMAVFLAPITEEVLFRGAVFGFFRRWNRTAAYLLSMLLFSVYHVWGYAVADPVYWIFILQYLPAAWLLCRCYERTNTIWCSIFFHMLVNLISIRALLLLEELL